MPGVFWLYSFFTMGKPMDHTFHFLVHFLWCVWGQGKIGNNLPAVKSQDMAGTKTQNNKTVDLNN